MTGMQSRIMGGTGLGVGKVMEIASGNLTLLIRVQHMVQGMAMIGDISQCMVL
jgi:hypothetical protein